jgi:hypothetical protein
MRHVKLISVHGSQLLAGFIMKLSLINVLGFLGARVGATTSIDENVASEVECTRCKL